MWDPETASLEDLQEALEMGSESLAEIKCQYGSECSLYGDAWPGACEEIQSMRASLSNLRAIMQRRFPQPERPVFVASDPDEDIPF